MVKVKIQQVAQKAGVSVATVDRVLNQRRGVREATAARVRDAIQSLNYQPDRLAARLAKSTSYRFGFVLPTGHNLFMRDLERELRANAERLASERIFVNLMHTDVFSGNELAAFLEQIDDNYDGIGVVALDHPAVSDAIDGLVARGIKVVTMVSDLPGSARNHFVGIDNVAAGRTAASLLGRLVGERGGKIGLLVASLGLRDHAERKYGFEQLVAQEFPELVVLPPLQSHDIDVDAGQAVARLIEQNPDLVGLYNTGAGNHEIIRAIEEAGMQRMVFIGHELNQASRRGLLSGVMDAVINQDASHEIRSALRVLEAAVENRPIIDTQERIRIDIYLRENLPPQGLSAT